MKTLAALIVFVFVSTLLATVLALSFGGLNPLIAALAAGAGVIAGFSAWQTTRTQPAPRLRFWDWIMLTVFALATFRAFGWLVFSRGDEVFVLSPNNLGDLSLHIGFIRYFASGVSFWPESPILSGVSLTYPIGADLFNALGEIWGWDTFRGLILVGLAGAALTGFALWRWGGAFALAALLFNGGLAGFAFLTTFHFEDFQQSLNWKNFFLSMLVTQRGLLFALPAGLLLLMAWRDEYFREKSRWLPHWVQIVLYAGMPIFNFHAFLFLSVVLCAIFLSKKPARRPLLLLLAFSFLPATVFVCLITDFFSAAGGLHWAPNWMADGGGWLVWVWNFGLTLPLLLILGILLIRNKDTEARCFVWTALLVFAVCCVVAFAPWPWDNMKLILWSWLVAAPYLWEKVFRPLPKVAGGALCIVLFFSGAVSLIGGLDMRHGYSIAIRSELAAWQAAVADIPGEARFACVPDYNHPLLLLGRKVVCGYEGHLWSHGLNYHDTMDLLRKAFSGSVRWDEAAPSLQAEWLAIRKKDGNIMLPAPESQSPSSMGTLYRLRQLTPSPDNQSIRPEPPRSVDLSL